MISPLLGTSALPSEVVIGGGAFPIRTDFRVGIRFEEMMYDARLTDAGKVALALSIWFPERPDADLGRVIDAMLTFYRCGKPQGYDEGSGNEQLYSFEHDWDAIFAGFLAAYGIDLLDDATCLHWWRFRSLLMALPEDSQLMRIIGHRAAKVTADMSREQKAHIHRMHRIFALPNSDAMRPVRIRGEEGYRTALAAVRAAKRGTR